MSLAIMICALAETATATRTTRTPRSTRSAFQCPDGTPPPCSRQAVVPPNSVGVMVFNNVTRDSSYAYLADGLATDIATSLARIPRLDVRSPGVVRAAQRAGNDPQVVGRRLNVRYMVEGDFQRGGDRIRVSVRLVTVANGTQRWTESYTRPIADVLAVQEEIASAVATAIAGQLLPQERRVLSDRPTRNPVAWDHFVRGNYALAMRDSAGYVRALAEYQLAYRADTTFVAALARQASTYMIAAGVLPMARETLLARTAALAAEAVRRAPESAESWFAMSAARLAQHPRTLTGVRDAIDRALAIDSNNADVLHASGVEYSYRGDMQRALAHYHRALAVDPLRPVTLNNLAAIALLFGRYDEALRWTDSLQRIDHGYAPERWRGFRLTALLAQGDTAAAGAEVRLWESLPSVRRFASAFQDILRVAESDSARLDQLVGERLAAIRRGWEPGFAGSSTIMLLAAVAALKGAAPATVVRLLDEAARSAQVRVYLGLPLFDRMRSDPGFQRIYAETAP